MTDMKVGDKVRIWCGPNGIITGFNLEGNDKSGLGRAIEVGSYLEVTTLCFMGSSSYLVSAPKTFGWLAKDHLPNEASRKEYGIDADKRYFWLNKVFVFPLKEKCKQCYE